MFIKININNFAEETKKFFRIVICLINLLMHYNINQLEELTGIKAHTIRIWEKRYNILVPKRTKTNIRYYNEQDLKKFLLIAILYNNDIKISEIAALSDEKLKDAVTTVKKISNKYETQIQLLLIATTNFDEQEFEKNILQIVMQLGFEKTFINIIEPFLKKINILFLTNSINKAKKNYVRNLLLRYISSAVNNLIYQTTEPNKRFILFSPDNQLDEILLQFVEYYLKKRHCEVINVGKGITTKDVNKIILTKLADNLLFIAYNQASKNSIFLKEFTNQFPKHNIFIIDLQKKCKSLQNSKMKIFHNLNEYSLEFENKK